MSHGVDPCVSEGGPRGRTATAEIVAANRSKDGATRTGNRAARDQPYIKCKPWARLACPPPARRRAQIRKSKAFSRLRSGFHRRNGASTARLERMLREAGPQRGRPESRFHDGN